VERLIHTLPLDKDGNPTTTNFSSKDITFLRENVVDPWTTEIPANIAKRLYKIISPGTGRVSILEFVGFKLRNVFPQNICRMKDGTVVVCDEFRQHSTGYRVYGRKFRRNDNLYSTFISDEIGRLNSTEVGVSIVSQLTNTLECWNATEVVSKCGLFPKGIRQSPASPPGATKHDLKTWRSWYCSEMLL
jgi:hypothetical protein